MSNKTEKDWKNTLTPMQFQVCRCGATEPAFTGAFYNKKDEGTYICVACRAPLFLSGTKYDSGSGWPSFWAPFDEKAIAEVRDTSHGMVRTEVKCAGCDSHLGHLFPDGPEPTGMRYCINSASLDFVKA